MCGKLFYFLGPKVVWNHKSSIISSNFHKQDFIFFS